MQEKLNGILRLLKNSVANFTEYAAYLYDDKFILFKNQNAELDAELEARKKQYDQSQMDSTNPAYLFVEGI